ncbi:hypothetical protein [uncultured Gammaproteobacteria bacterium]|nr:hypothetical protein [uncultured Gammaproteobacteria bacterium]CAC9655395.1 hypothetical protein [uncultured Gammaproteobacteria bacterium]
MPAVISTNSPPHRWLRKIDQYETSFVNNSPPHRWLRKLERLG